MEERGLLIRKALPAQLRELLANISPRWKVEGRDATGQKSEIPWVRVFDAQLSPNARNGWYLVYLFDRPGNRVWLSLNQGTTTWANGEFQALPRFVLRERVGWARRVAGHLPHASVLDIDLRAERTNLGAQYEAGNVVAFDYPLDALPSEDAIRSDLRVMLNVLESVLAASVNSLDEPGEPAPDLVSAIMSISEAAAPRIPRLYRVSAEERRAVEVRAVEVAGAYLNERGYKVKDVGATESYDLHATRQREVLKVEVKGTVGDGAEVILTRNEVALHRAEFPNTMLAIVARIRLDRNPLSATGGSLRTVQPWRPEDDNLAPLAYSYQVPVLD